jgi:hypothetical protein
MFTIKDAQGLITHCEKMLKEGAEENKEHYLKTVKTANEQLQKLLLAPPVNQNAVVKSESHKIDHNVRTIERTLAGQPIFYGNNDKEAEGFISIMEQLFYLLVTQIDPNLEADFLVHLKLRFGVNVFSQMQTCKMQLNTFESIKKFIRERFGGNYNAFQRVSRIFDVPFNPNDKFQIYATKLNQEVSNSLAAIKDHYAKINENDQLTPEQVMEFMGGILAAENIRRNFFDIHKDMTKDFDVLTGAVSVMNQAEFYRERQIAAIPGNDTFFSRGHPKQSNRNRPRFLGNNSGPNTQKQENRKFGDKNSDDPNFDENRTNFVTSIYGENSPFQK